MIVNIVLISTLLKKKSMGKTNSSIFSYWLDHIFSNYGDDYHTEYVTICTHNFHKLITGYRKIWRDSKSFNPKFLITVQDRENYKWKDFIYNLWTYFWFDNTTFQFLRVSAIKWNSFTEWIIKIPWFHIYIA